MTVVWTDQVVIDLRDILEHIEQQSPSNAALVAERVNASVELLAQTPHIGRLTKRKNVREFNITNTSYVLSYRVGPDFLLLRTLRRGARNR